MDLEARTDETRTNEVRTTHYSEYLSDGLKAQRRMLIAAAVALLPKHLLLKQKPRICFGACRPYLVRQ